MNNKRMILSETARAAVGKELQSVLVHAIDLGMQTKQAHWNVQGPSFHPLHTLLDEFHGQQLGVVDDVAERAVILGVPADGRVGAVVSASTLPPFPEGFVRDKEVVSAVSDRIAAVVSVVRKAVDVTGELDPISQDLLIGVTDTLEKQLWFLQSHEL